MSEKRKDYVSLLIYDIGREVIMEDCPVCRKIDDAIKKMGLKP